MFKQVSKIKIMNKYDKNYAHSYHSCFVIKFKLKISTIMAVLLDLRM
jgi:hypothetical protein